jgi:hypothetical protein
MRQLQLASAMLWRADGLEPEGLMESDIWTADLPGRSRWR